MAHISGTFSDPRPGKLLVALKGTFQQGSRRDAGFPDTGNPGNLLIRAFVGPVGASRKYSEPIDRYVPTVVLSVDYPGGVSWPVGTEEVAHVNPGSGLWSYGIADLNITLKLFMK